MIPEEHLTWNHEEPLKDPPTVFILLFYIALLTMVLIWTTIEYPIKVAYIIGIWKTTCFIPPTEAELMGGHICMRERHDSLCLRASPKDNIILTHYILSA